MSDSERIEFPISRKKMALALLGSAALLAASSLLAFTEIASSSVAVRAFGILGLVFFGLCAGSALARIAYGGPALVLEMDGLTDHSSGLAAGFVPWSNIAEFGPVTFGEQNFLGIAVRDLSAFKATLRRRRLRFVDWNLRQGLPPILIPQVSLTQSVQAVADEMWDFVVINDLLNAPEDEETPEAQNWPAGRKA
jgi:hypothetical protein